MRSGKVRAANSVLRNLPSVDDLLRSEAGIKIAAQAGNDHAVAIARLVLAELRRGMAQSGSLAASKETLASSAVDRLDHAWRLELLSGARRVINATGVVIHTNLGRAPLSENARTALLEAAGYGTLEFDVETGKRGRRAARVEELIKELTGAEDALVVNNCAAAAFFVLTAFAKGGEVVVSRGELVEIGGDFRVPDVCAQSGATLKEVGTTNRTKLADYDKAIGKKTRVILRVHPSNYRIVGFTATPSIGDLAAIAKKHKLLFYEDIGSGALIDLGRVGVVDEPIVRGSLEAGADVVTFSGDKLLGGPQSGIIAGKKRIIEPLRKHPLYRALRVDKLVLATLEATLESYRREPLREIPVLQMLSAGEDEIAARVDGMVHACAKAIGKGSNFKFEIVNGESAVGGGAAPAVKLKTKLIAISHKNMVPVQLERMLRLSDPPVITRIAGDRVMIDLRTVAVSEEGELLNTLMNLN